MDEEKLKAQEKLCMKWNYPIFVPADWICFKCKKNMAKKITLEEASKKQITSCPWCNISFVD